MLPHAEDWGKKPKMNADEFFLWGNAVCCSSPPPIHLPLRSSTAALVFGINHQRADTQSHYANNYWLLFYTWSYSLVLLWWGLTQCAYTLTNATHKWMAFLRAAFAQPEAIKCRVELLVVQFFFLYHIIKSMCRLLNTVYCTYIGRFYICYNKEQTHEGFRLSLAQRRYHTHYAWEV